MPDPATLASRIVWFDALVTNVDRTPRNTNMLVWHGKLWLIDHGASLYFHHNWNGAMSRSRAPFAQISSHVLRPWATRIMDVDESMAEMLTPPVIEAIVDVITETWLGDAPEFATIDDHRAAYRQWLSTRLESPRIWVEEAARV